MSDIAIRVENLGKMYRIGIEERRPDNLWQAARQLAASPFDYLRRIARPPTEEETLWALKDVSFEVQRGEVVGMIGRNGAGKSTLLKILTRITEPTEGHAELHGRVGSLLEVGTGFHPELTGRENIYLNGAILGMKRVETDRKFDEIVDFSGIEKFIDTPVKRYSSGMYVRLAFAVAAHMDPEILLVDEVLAVGDAEFQKKCLGKMGRVAQEGRTVLFVSHNMSAINELCSKAILLKEGTITKIGETRDVTDHYLASVSDMMLTPIKERTDRTGNGQIRFTDVKLFVEGKEVKCISSGKDVTVEMTYEADKPLAPQQARFAFSLLTMSNIKFMAFDSATTQLFVDEMGKRGVVRCHIPNFPLVRGRYKMLLYAQIDSKVADRLEDASEFEVMSGKYPNVGWLSVEQEWELESSE